MRKDNPGVVRAIMTTIAALLAFSRDRPAGRHADGERDERRRAR